MPDAVSHRVAASAIMAGSEKESAMILRPGMQYGPMLLKKILDEYINFRITFETVATRWQNR